MIDKSEIRNQKSGESPKSKILSHKCEPARTRARRAEICKTAREAGTSRHEDAVARQASTSPPLPFRVNEPPPRPSPLSEVQTLSCERQEELFRYCETHSLKQTVRWLAKAGVKTSQPSITRFRRWFHRRRLYDENLAIVKNMIEERRRNEPNVSEAELALFGRKMFAQLAIDTEDERSWARQQWVRQRQMKLDLDRARFGLAREQFDSDVAEACLDHFPLIQAAVASPALSRYEKIERIHQVLCIVNAQ
jgi:hypothetical protein